MTFVSNSSLVSVLEWSGVAASVTGSVLNAHGRRSCFLLWTVSALLLGTVAFALGRSGWLALQGTGVAINLYGMRNWQGDAPTRTQGPVN